LFGVSQMSLPIRLTYQDIAIAPTGTGVYAWYSSIFIGKRDLETFVNEVNARRVQPEQAVRYVGEELDALIFKRYQEDDYNVTIKGSLKPKYEGTAKHMPSAPKTLVSRLIDQPDRLALIAEALGNAAPYFTAPLYIGMAQNLRERLMRHKSMIDSQLDQTRSRVSTDLGDGDAGFAKQVVARGFDPMSLFVYVQELDVKNNEHVDLENILNRINFPIFGRN
jgi:hypothetical protein